MTFLQLAGRALSSRQASRQALPYPSSVQLSRPLRRHYSKQPNAFVDRITVVVKAGNGGPGCASFAKGPNKEVAPPDGGHGGNGGSVRIEASANCTSLRIAALKVRAQNGGPGFSAKRHGKNGSDLVIPVPPGTVIRERPHIRDDPFSEPCAPEPVEEILVAELNEDGQQAEVARGGTGGRGNVAFKSSRNRSPTKCDSGEAGETRRLELELKSIADIGLVGFPNAGKSTFLRAISKAKPKVASYPFTTLRPHIGVVQTKSSTDEFEDRSMTVADIPGLIEGAHDNRGLGHEFLRHIERTKFLAYVLDMSSPSGEMVDDLAILRNELELHEEGLSKRQSCIVANKMDSGPRSHENLNSLLRAVGDSTHIFPVSAKYRSGVDEVIRHFNASVA